VPHCTGLVWDEARSRRSRRGCLVRVGVGTWSRRPVELASYETDPVRGRGALSLLWLVVSFFFIVGCGYPYTIGTDTKKKPSRGGGSQSSSRLACWVWAPITGEGRGLRMMGRGRSRSNLWERDGSRSEQNSWERREKRRLRKPASWVA
jgi:hypothetical protein